MRAEAGRPTRRQLQSFKARDHGGMEQAGNDGGGECDQILEINRRRTNRNLLIDWM